MEVLRSVIEEFISSGDPVGSRTLSKVPGLDWSAATLRNVMADLEESGHLYQPHASAGRVPTEKGYRWYVDQLREHAPLPDEDEALITQTLQSEKSDLDALLDTATRLLTRLSRYAAVVISPSCETAVVAHVDFVRLAPRRILVILATSGGNVQHVVVETEQDYSGDDLTRFSRYALDTFRGLTLSQARGRVQELIQQEMATYDQLIKGALAISSRMFGQHEPPDLHVEGIIRFLDAPEFARIDRLRGILEVLEDKERLLRILDEVLADGDLQVTIGAESRIPDLTGVSVVSTSYRAGSRLGALGVIGPTRMNYDRTVTVVDRVADVLSRRLESLNDTEEHP